MSNALSLANLTGFKPFLSEGLVSLEGSFSQVPIKILRDTAATQSLLLEGLLPLGLSTSTGENVIAQGIEGGYVNVPYIRSTYYHT